MTKHSKMLAIILPYLDQGYFNHIAIGAERAAREHGYLITVSTTLENPELESTVVQRLIHHRADGFLIIPAIRSQVIQQIQQVHLPVVAVDRDCLGTACRVIADHYLGVYQGTAHLLQNGHRRIGYIGWNASISTITMRSQAFWQAIDNYQISRKEVVMKVGGITPEDGYRMAKEILADPKITALFISQGHTAKGVIQAAFELGRKIPDDLSVVVHGENEWAQLIDPPLTGNRLPDYQQGEKAVELLLKQINDNALTPCCVTLPTEFIPGHSVQKLN